jgi:inorganic pyrophosphatase
LNIEYIKNKNGMQNITCTMIVEQTYEYKKRIRYIPDKNEFIETEHDSLLYLRNVPFPYGWIKESGKPPEQHLDVYLVSTNKYHLGDEIAIKLIGVFIRRDKDNKFVGLLPDRDEADISELSDFEKGNLVKTYPRIDPGEGWFGKEKVLELIVEWNKGNYR